MRMQLNEQNTRCELPQAFSGSLPTSSHRDRIPFGDNDLDCRCLLNSALECTSRLPILSREFATPIE